MTTREDLFAAKKTRSKNVELTIDATKLVYQARRLSELLLLDSTIAMEVK